ncbi:MAG: hypothetical protein U0228_00450 [Myxococcaceae bacterium]
MKSLVRHCFTERLLPLALASLALLGCPQPEPMPDASTEVDSGQPPPPPTPCDSPEDCRALGQVCRQLVCAADVPCGDDLECGLGERCVAGQCRFTGCTSNDECSTHFCDVATFSCAECATGSDCPTERPVCDVALRQCVQCLSDAECGQPGPAFCSPEGRCVACLTNDQCPNGLQCTAGHSCVGAPVMAPCPEGTSCGPDLVCVTLNGANTCLEACSLYQPACASGDICFSLTYSSTNSHVFESNGPIGVCFAPQSGLRNAREPCTVTNGQSNCQPNLACMPETSSLSLCRPYCDPFTSGMCAAGEVCTSFVGDFNGREFGLCMPDRGFGTKCTGDRNCRPGLSCQPWDDPSDPDEVGVICQFNVGDGGALSPCRPVTQSDGGVLSADRACRSGFCANDPLAFSTPTDGYFCFGACSTDADCGDAGVCDAEFFVTTSSGALGFQNGCRPTCAEERECGGFLDGGLTCKVRVVSSSSAPVFNTTCSPPPGPLPTGATCTSSFQCRSGYCSLDDSRGVRRPGVCTSPCVDSSACAVDGGVFPTQCQPTALLLNRGFDGTFLTPDDVFLTRRVCSGRPCADDGDCRPDGGSAVCAPAASPTAPTTQAALRCANPVGALHAGDSCVLDTQCESGVCGTLQAPSTGSGRACFQACTGATACPGTTTCRAGGMSVQLAAGTVNVDSCAP